MQGLLGIGIAVQIAACAVVGIRLLLLSARTREIPELALGSSFLLMGAIGYPLSIVARSGAGGPSLLALALAAQNLSAICMYVSTWKSFRPRQRGVALIIGATLLAFAMSLGIPFALGEREALDAGPWYYVGFAGRFASYSWAAAEAVRYAAIQRRRLALGLADPVVADRFQLWSITSTSISLGFVVFLAGRLFSENVGASPFVLVPTSIVSVSAGVTMWLAFFPPRRYKRLIVERYLAQTIEET